MMILKINHLMDKYSNLIYNIMISWLVIVKYEIYKFLIFNIKLLLDQISVFFMLGWYFLYY